MELNSLARTLAERLVELKEATVLVCDFDVECVNPESAIGVAKLITEDLEAVIREAIDKTQQQERLRLADEAEKSSYLRLVLADVPKHVALWLRGQA